MSATSLGMRNRSRGHRRQSILEDAGSAIRAGLEEARRGLRQRGVHVPELEGKLLRPMVAYALVPPSRRDALDEGFWIGALAIQMVHEASLLHDDILDAAKVRRGVETHLESEGVGPALVLGDLYLTGSYRAAAEAGIGGFLETFIEAVERTVAGEVAQGGSAGERLSPDRYEEIVRSKSGALFGAAALLAAPGRDHDVSSRRAFGETLGATYQRIDDLLDYCSAFPTGKPPLQDYRQRKWTWVLDLLEGVDGFDLPAHQITARLFEGGAEGHSPARRALKELRRRSSRLLAWGEELSPGDQILASLLDDWLDVAERAVASRSYTRKRRARPAPTGPSVEAEVREAAMALGGPDAWGAYFGDHARTFHLASRLFPPEAAKVVTGVYAFCRFTDDLVDDPADGAAPDRLRGRLAAWRQLAEQAWKGADTGIPLLDRVLGESAARDVSFSYPTALLDGVAMDLDGATYPDWDALERYTFCVAGAVGGWLTQAFGYRDEALLDCAHALGHAMQLTNIARDVGEDLERGRVYLPLHLLSSHELDPEVLGTLPGPSGSVPRAYVQVMEAVLSRADARYAHAWPGIRALPGWYRRPVAAAAHAYRGIHDEIRRNGYDNLTRRAYTSRPRKLWLAGFGVARTLPFPFRARLEETTA